MLVTSTPTRQRLGQLEPLPERSPAPLDSDRGLQLFLVGIIAAGAGALAVDALMKYLRRRR